MCRAATCCGAQRAGGLRTSLKDLQKWQGQARTGNLLLTGTEAEPHAAPPHWVGRRVQGCLQILIKGSGRTCRVATALSSAWPPQLLSERRLPASTHTLTFVSPSQNAGPKCHPVLWFHLSCSPLYGEYIEPINSSARIRKHRPSSMWAGVVACSG